MTEMGSIQAYPTKTSIPSYDKVTRFPLHSDDPSHLFDVHNPATGEVITTIQGCGEEEVATAVSQLHKELTKSAGDGKPQRRDLSSYFGLPTI